MLTLVGGAGAFSTDAPDGECCGAEVLFEAVPTETIDWRTLGEAIVWAPLGGLMEPAAAGGWDCEMGLRGGKFAATGDV